MDHMKGSSGESLPMQEQQEQTQQQQQQKLKKKSKNKKKSSRTEVATTTLAGTTTGAKKDVNVNANDSSEVHDDLGLAVNGLSDQLKQQLHMSGSRDASSNSHASKVNGLVTEKHVNTNACPNKTNAADSSELLHKPLPALNGHHPDEEQSNAREDVNDVNQASIKKTKRKPNNKKNPPITDNLAATKENGHCPSNKHNNSANPASEKEEKQHLHNGYGHNHGHENKVKNSQQQITITKGETTQSPTTIDNKTAMTTPAANAPAKEQNSKDKEESTKSLEGVESPAVVENPLVDLDLSNVHIEYKEYESELQMHDIMRLIQAELSEPYSIYTYRYFIYNWPKLCFLAAHGNEYIGAIVCKLGMHMNVRRGYIAMLAVRKEYRKLKIGTTLVQKAIEAMLADKADEVVLETEMSNLPALRLYENLGFVRDKRLFRYYLNGVDALRLKLWFR